MLNNCPIFRFVTSNPYNFGGGDQTNHVVGEHALSGAVSTPVGILCWSDTYDFSRLIPWAAVTSADVRSPHRVSAGPQV